MNTTATLITSWRTDSKNFSSILYKKTAYKIRCIFWKLVWTLQDKLKNRTHQTVSCAKIPPEYLCNLFFFSQPMHKSVYLYRGLLLGIIRNSFNKSSTNDNSLEFTFNLQIYQTRNTDDFKTLKCSFTVTWSLQNLVKN